MVIPGELSLELKDGTEEIVSEVVCSELFGPEIEVENVVDGPETLCAVIQGGHWGK